MRPELQGELPQQEEPVRRELLAHVMVWDAWKKFADSQLVDVDVLASEALDRAIKFRTILGNSDHFSTLRNNADQINIFLNQRYGFLHERRGLIIARDLDVTLAHVALAGGVGQNSFMADVLTVNAAPYVHLGHRRI